MLVQPALTLTVRLVMMDILPPPRLMQLVKVVILVLQVKGYRQCVMQIHRRCARLAVTVVRIVTPRITRRHVKFARLVRQGKVLRLFARQQVTLSVNIVPKETHTARLMINPAV